MRRAWVAILALLACADGTSPDQERPGLDPTIGFYELVEANGEDLWVLLRQTSELSEWLFNGHLYLAPDGTFELEVLTLTDRVNGAASIGTWDIGGSYEALTSGDLSMVLDLPAGDARHIENAVSRDGDTAVQLTLVFGSDHQREYLFRRPR